MKEYGKLDLRNCDCMELMAQYHDKYFDLAIVDPPYGIGRDGGESGKNWKVYDSKQWDSSAPGGEYFNELWRVSVNQIIWGANYFTEHIPPSMGWVYWDKGQKLTMSDGELAYTSFDRALRSVTINRCHISEAGGLIHPTAKPLMLYKWLLSNYAKSGDRILDTHLGSGSIAIACYYMGFDLVGSELDPDYYAAMMQRIERETAQQELF